MSRVVTINRRIVPIIKLLFVLACWAVDLQGVASQQWTIQASDARSASAATAVGPMGVQPKKQTRKKRRRRRKCLAKRARWLNKRRCRSKRHRIPSKHPVEKQVDHLKVMTNPGMAIKLSWPLEHGKFWKSSPFGYRRLDGVLKFHTGLDLAAPRNTPVRAAAAGIALEVRYDRGFGNMILLQHSDGVKTRYGHLHRFKIRQNQQVKKGQLIGTVGATGNVRGNGTDKSHLHFEVLVHGTPKNPLRYLR